MQITTTLKTLEKFTEVASTVENPAIKKWKNEGGKVVGYFCSFIPEEILTAAGLLPFRVRATGSKGTELADAYTTSTNCTYCRHMLTLALAGDYDFLDGAVWVNSCDQIRRTYDNWVRKVKTPFTHFMSLPKKAGEDQIKLYRDELAQYGKLLGNHFGVEISDDKLRKAIKLHNETRRLQRKLYDFRKGKNPLLTGAEMLTITVAGSAMPKEEYNSLLSELVEEVNKREPITGYRARLMVVGGILDNPEYLKVIEDLGGLVVTDSLCYGSRNLWVDVNEEGDPWYALSRSHMLERPGCPRMYGDLTGRFEYLKMMIKEFNVEGLITERIQFCDSWGYESYLIKHDFAEAKMDTPLLFLDREYILSGVGQMKTRVQAFLETIEGGK